MQKLTARYGTINLILLALVLAGLGVYIWSGQYARFLADDYCSTMVGLEHGAVDGMIQMYFNYSARFVTHFLKSLIAPFGPGFAAILAWLLIGGLSVALVWTLRSVAAWLKLRQAGFFSLFMGALLALATVSGTFSTTQSFYWIGGSIPYTLPLVLLVAYIGLLLRWLRSPRLEHRLWLLALVTALIGIVVTGLSDVFGAMFITLWVCVWGIAWLKFPRQRHIVLSVFLPGLISASATLLFILLAPGSVHRQAALVRETDPFTMVSGTIVGTFSGIASIVILFGPAQMLLVLLVTGKLLYDFRTPALPFRLRPAQVYKWMGISALVATTLTASVIAPSIYTASVTPAERTYVIPQLIIVITVAFWGGLMSLSLRKPDVARPNRVGAVLLGGLLVALALVVLVGALDDAGMYATYAREWDARDALIREAIAQGETSVSVPPFTVDETMLASLEPVSINGEWWTNRCAARYYNLDELVVEPS